MWLKMAYPLPAELIELRRAVVDSYKMRDKSWRADPMLVSQLVAAEQAHTATVFRAMHGRASDRQPATDGNVGPL